MPAPAIAFCAIVFVWWIAAMREGWQEHKERERQARKYESNRSK